MNPDCIFCHLENHHVVEENELATAILDGFPVTEGHVLIVPRRHFSDLFEITPDEWLAVMQLMLRVRTHISIADPEVSGFNIGVNAGASAGQTIGHCHIHLIPRRDGDVDDPTGGVRGVIPQKQNYRTAPVASEYVPEPAPAAHFVPRMVARPK